MSMEKQASELDVRKILRMYIEHWWWFVISGVICVVIGTIYYVRKTPTWQTDASIVLRTQEMGGGQLDALSLLGMAANPATSDEVDVLTSRGLMAQSLDALHLWEPTYVKGGLRWEEEYPSHAISVECIKRNRKMEKRSFSVVVKPTRSGYKVKTKAGHLHRSSVRVPNLDEPIETCIGTIRVHAHRSLSQDTSYRAFVTSREALVADYGELLTIDHQRSESNIIVLAMRSNLPARDKALLFQLIEQYNINAILDKNMIASNTTAFINDRLNRVEEELLESEKEVAIYKEKNSIADIETQARLMLEAGSEEQLAMTEIETQLSLVDYVDGFVSDETKRYSLIPANIGIEDAALETSLSEYNTVLLQRMRIQRTATDSNPVLEQMDSQLQSMRQHIIATIGSVRGSLQIRLNNLKEQDSKFNRQIKNAPEMEREYVRVVRDQKIKEQLYLFLYQKREENAIMQATTSMPAKILDTPQQDLQSNEPKLSHIWMLCMLLGLMISAVVLYALMLLRNWIDDEQDFEYRIKLPNLGHLVENSRNDLIAIHEGESTISDELFRSIRTNLRFVLPSEIKNPVILVSSYRNGEGKTYVAANLALSLAILGKKVALVGMDLRKPMLDTCFGMPGKGCMTDYLAGADLKLDDLIIAGRGHKNLDVIPCGSIPPNPSELLQADRAEELFAELRKRYDYIIVDTAPLAMVSDTYLLDRIADMTIMVFRYKYSQQDSIEAVNKIVEQKRMHRVVCVLNGIKGFLSGYGQK